MKHYLSSSGPAAILSAIFIAVLVSCSGVPVQDSNPDDGSTTEPQPNGSIVVAILGLPPEIDLIQANVQVSVGGNWVAVPDGGSLSVEAGTYQFRAAGTLSHSTANPRFRVNYLAVAATGQIVVTSGPQALLTVRYEMDSGALAISVPTTDASPPAVIHLHRPDGTVETYTGSQHLDGLPVGTYGVGVEGRGGLVAAPAFQQVEVLSGQERQHSISFSTRTGTWLTVGPALRGSNGLDGSAVFNSESGGTLVVTDDRIVEIDAPSRRTETLAWLSSLDVVNSAVARVPDGTIIISGGMTGSGASVRDVFGFDPDTRSVKPLPPLAIDRHLHSMTPLSDGRLVVIGGVRGQGLEALKEIELYDPLTGSTVLPVTLAEARVTHEAVAIGDGRVLVIGGLTRVPSSAATTIEMVDPETLSVGGVGSLGREAVGARALVSGGKVFVIGGLTSELISTVDLGTLAIVSNAATLPSVRAFHGVTALPDGRIAITGGSTSWTINESALRSMVILDPSSGTVSSGGFLPQPLTGHAAFLDSSGELIVGAGGSPMALPVMPFMALPASAF